MHAPVDSETDLPDQTPSSLYAVAQQQNSMDDARRPYESRRTVYVAHRMGRLAVHGEGRGILYVACVYARTTV
eukprot:COSAG05_NODE_765_length_7475_cov_6.478986_4_plen_73_part_00